MTITYSLICGTLGRSKEFDLMLNSLSKQSYKNFELIVVDQNVDGLIDHIIEKYKYTVDIKHIKTNKNGLSRARNLGINSATGKILAFPDDDCIYGNQVLEFVAKFFENGVDKAVTVATVDKLDEIRYLTSDVDMKELSILDLFKDNNFISYCAFVSNVKGVKFDEELGVGAIYQSSEESDYIFKCVSLFDFKLFSAKEIKIYHPFKDDIPERNFEYGIGYGAFISKNFNKSRLTISFYLIRTIVKQILKSIIYFLWKKDRSLSAILYTKGILEGMKLSK